MSSETDYAHKLCLKCGSKGHYWASNLGFIVRCSGRHCEEKTAYYDGDLDKAWAEWDSK